MDIDGHQVHIFAAVRHGTAQLAHFHEDMGDVVMALAKETRWAHAVELARRRRWGWHLG